MALWTKASKTVLSEEGSKDTQVPPSLSVTPLCLSNASHLRPWSDLQQARSLFSVVPGSPGGGRK